MDDKQEDFTDAELSDIAEADYKSLIDNHIHRATYGAVASAKAILTEFCACVENQTSEDGERFLGNGENYIIDRRIIRYLARCFQNILDGTDTKRALNLKAFSKQADPNRCKKQAELSHEAQVLIDAGMKPLDAYAMVAKRHYPNGKGERAVKEAHNNFAAYRKAWKRIDKNTK